MLRLPGHVPPLRRTRAEDSVRRLGTVSNGTVDGALWTYR